MGISLDCSNVQVSELWSRFYNGPNAGLIDVALARKEMPWLIGEGMSVQLSSSATSNITTTADTNGDVSERCSRLPSRTLRPLRRRTGRRSSSADRPRPLPSRPAAFDARRSRRRSASRSCSTPGTSRRPPQGSLASWKSQATIRTSLAERGGFDPIRAKTDPSGRL
jgi:hypothetical protein